MALPTFTVGRKVRASELAAIVDTLNVASATATDFNVSRTTTSTSYTSTVSPANICGVAFVAPPSGKVQITWSCEQANAAASTGAYTSVAIRQGSTVGSGTSFLGSADQYSMSFGDNAASQFHHASMSRQITGLTPGTTYNVCLEHRVSANTGTFQQREVDVVPLLA